MSGWYILLDRIAVPATIEEWSRWSAGPGRGRKHVAETRIGPLYISTVFLGLDQGFGSEHPILFETMVFDPDAEPGTLTDVGGYQTRCETWGEAERMHEIACAWATVLLASTKLVWPPSDKKADPSDIP